MPLSVGEVFGSLIKLPGIEIGMEGILFGVKKVKFYSTTKGEKIFFLNFFHFFDQFDHCLFCILDFEIM